MKKRKRHAYTSCLIQVFCDIFTTMRKTYVESTRTILQYVQPLFM
jgi:hypothetical protein